MYTFNIKGNLTYYDSEKKNHSENKNETITGAGKVWVSYNTPNRMATETDKGLTVTELKDQDHSLDIDGYTYVGTEVTYNFCNTLGTESRVPGNKSLVANNVEVSTTVTVSPVLSVATGAVSS